MRQTLPDCCARAANGHPAAAPPTSVMNSRRLTGRPLKQKVLPYHAVGCIVHHGKFGLLMSALGQKQTSEHVQSMSALPPKADIAVLRLSLSLPSSPALHLISFRPSGYLTPAERRDRVAESAQSMLCASGPVQTPG